MKYIRWRKNSAYCCYPVPGWPHWYRLKVLAIKGTKAEKDILERKVIAPRLLEIQAAAVNQDVRLQLEAELFEKPEDKAPAKYTGPWKMTYDRCAARYWYYRLKRTKSGRNERYHLDHSIEKFKGRLAESITEKEITDWMNSQLAKEESVNVINNRFAYMCAVFNFSTGRVCREKLLTEFNPRRQITNNPTLKVAKLQGGNVRQYLLTPEKMEELFAAMKKIHPGIARYWLACWITDRRPMEVASYRIEWIDWNGAGISIPPTSTKTKKHSWVPISGRLMLEIQCQVGDRTEGLIFPNAEGNPWIYYGPGGQIRNNTARYMKKLKAVIPGAYVFRDTRRGRFTQMVDKYGLMPAMALSDHASTAIAIRYNITEREKLSRMVEETDVKPNLQIAQA